MHKIKYDESHEESEESDRFRFDTWKSEERNEEIHIYLKDEHDTYVLGYNPELIDKETIHELLERLA